MLVIADDFTGANDTGVLFTKHNMTVDIVLHWEQAVPSQADVIVVNTDSRAISSDCAMRRIGRILSQYSTEKKKYL
ncbi:four-carbon acid sugar kinase family protein [Pasteurellaceae bacterium LIM206]|nr:four-carbon acid sugar kinase family protein [Pasteurellaceae bacterium LIM206]